MAQLGNVLRIIFSGGHIEQAGGMLPWQRKVQDQNVWLDWRAETRRREGVEWVEEVAASGRITGAEVRFWADFFRNAPQVRKFPDRLGDVPAIPVARLWTPLAGEAAEFFLWPEPTGALVLMGLFTPDSALPHRRTTVESTVTAETLAAFATALESEYEALKSSLG